ncbi:MAG: hypothetical protein KME09_01210 [Pleurocapsa minor HA4230-MV1]|nr:hypothetical protein [Pleurocapsa minor HA4230-MV1]
MKVIRYKSKQWNQTNYYSLDRDRLAEFINLEMAGSIEMVEMCNTPLQDERNLPLEVRDLNISYIEPKITTKKETTEQRGDRQKTESPLAAASPKSAKDEDINQKGSNPHLASLTVSPGQIKSNQNKYTQTLMKIKHLLKLTI